MGHRDDTIVICQLVCVIDSWAHTSFVHSILSLKLGVTQTSTTRGLKVAARTRAIDKLLHTAAVGTPHPHSIGLLPAMTIANPYPSQAN